MISNKSISAVRSINIDIFRTILAQWVILGHLGPELLSIPIVPGRVAVWGFFIISGYLNAKSFLNRTESGTWFNSVTGYYLSRIKRIYPLLLLNALVVAIFLGTLFHSDWYVLFPYRHSYPYQLSNGGLWTLIIEIQLYLITPILFLLVLKSKAFNWKIQTLICMGLIFLVPLMKVYFAGNHDLIDDRTVTGNIGFYLFGMMLLLNDMGLPKLNKNLYFALWILLAILGLYFIFEYNFKYQGIQFILGPFIALLASFLVLTATTPLVNKGHSIFAFLGYYTYEIYVLHGLLAFIFYKLAMHGIWNILFMWWLMPIFLVVIFDMAYKKKYKLILK
jgi:peptidoglycan/LPS O-acetylase OafA/YrhL